MRNTLTLVLVVGLAMALAGYFAGRITGRNSATAAAEARYHELSTLSAHLSPKPGSSNSRSSTQPIPLSGKDMHYALSEAMAEPNPVSRMAAMSQLLASLDASNLDAALSVFKDVPIRVDNKDEYVMLLYSWAQFDGASAIAYVAENLNARGLPAEELRLAALSGWAAQDPTKAVAWLDAKVLADYEASGRKLKEGATIPVQTYRAAALIKGWAISDPYAAAEYLGERFQHGGTRESLMGHIVANIIRDGPEVATRWAESFDDPGLKEEAFEELAEDWSSIDPAATGQWLAQHLNEEYSREAVEDLARGWAVKDLDAAVEWFESLDDGLTRGTGIYELVKIWSDQDTEASGNWLDSLTVGSISRDMGVRAYVQEISGDNPEVAAQWLDTIHDDAIRQRAAPAVMQRWLRRDPDAAMLWAHGSNAFPEEQLQQYQQTVEKRRSAQTN